MVNVKAKSTIRQYSDALDFLFNNTEIKDVVVRFNSEDHVLVLIIRANITEIIVYATNLCRNDSFECNY